MRSVQLEIDGIGQQIYTLSDWKRENKIYTHKGPSDQKLRWSCWSDFEDPEKFISEHGLTALGYGDTERQCIEDFLDKWPEFEKPFWW